MTGRRAIVGLCMLCALVFSAIAAQGAAAASNGTTAFTCKSVTPAAGTAGFSDSACKNAVSANANFEHVAFSGSTNLTGTGGLTKLHSVISGIEFELQSTSLEGSGTMENMADVFGTGEHTVDGTGVIEYKGVTVTRPAGKGCVVTGGEVKTEVLQATTAGKGMGVEVAPNEGTLLAKFNVTGCSIAALNGKYEVKGSVIGIPEGTSIVTTGGNTTAALSLTLRGQKAGIDGAINLKGESGPRWPLQQLKHRKYLGRLTPDLNYGIN